MRRRTFLQTLAMAVAVPWTQLLAPSVREPVLSGPDAGWARIVYWDWHEDVLIYVMTPLPAYAL